MLAYSHFSILDFISRLVMPGVSIFLSTVLALHAIRRADLRERARRNRDELVALANEFMELAKKFLRDLSASKDRGDQAPRASFREIRRELDIAQTSFVIEHLHLTNKLRLLGRSGLVPAVEEFSSKAKDAYNGVLRFFDNSEISGVVPAMKEAIDALATKQQECFEIFMAALHHDESELSRGVIHRMRLRITAVIACLRRHFGMA